MPRTEKEIAAYIEYFRTAPKEERAWALNALSRQEGKTPAEIREICEKFKGTNLRKGMAAPDELYERIQSQLRAGQSKTEIMRDFGTSATTIEKAKRMMKKAEEKSAEEDKPEIREIREAYPGQISDSESFIEADVKTYIPHENIVAGECREKEADWFLMLDKLEIVVAGLFGDDASITEIHASGYDKRAGLTAEIGGKRYDIVIEEI